MASRFWHGTSRPMTERFFERSAADSFLTPRSRHTELDTPPQLITAFCANDFPTFPAIGVEKCSLCSPTALAFSPEGSFMSFKALRNAGAVGFGARPVNLSIISGHQPPPGRSSLVPAEDLL